MKPQGKNITAPAGNPPTSLTAMVLMNDWAPVNCLLRMKLRKPGGWRFVIVERREQAPFAMDRIPKVKERR